MGWSAPEKKEGIFFPPCWSKELVHCRWFLNEHFFRKHMKNETPKAD